jgi:hypothetical protein
MPRYQHDCDLCTPLGENGEFDLYFCPQGDLPDTLIARFGDAGAAYMSGLDTAIYQEKMGRTTEPLVLALRAARERGLIPTT